jgi:hypothetical protein
VAESSDCSLNWEWESPARIDETVSVERTRRKEDFSGVKGIRTADDTYALETFKHGDGAPPGTYLVQLGTNDVTTIGVQVPETKPASVIIPNEGGQVSVDLEGTGKTRPGLLPPPKGQGAKRHG